MGTAAQEDPDSGAAVLSRWYAVRALLALEWSPSVLVALTERPKHYTELLEDASALHLAAAWGTRHGQLHESTLTRTLKQLTQDGLVERHEDHGAFITAVTYSLTAAAGQLLDAVLPLTEWATGQDELLRRARMVRDEAAASEPESSG